MKHNENLFEEVTRLTQANSHNSEYQKIGNKLKDVARLGQTSAIISGPVGNKVVSRLRSDGFKVTFIADIGSPSIKVEW